MTAETISVGDIGTDFRATITEAGVAVNISGASALVLEFTKPDGTVEEHAASLLNDGTDGIMQYVTASGDIDQAGEWSYRAKVTFSASEVFYSNNPKPFMVL